MNILFVHEILGNFGGAESNLLATATELCARGHRVGLLTQRSSGKGEDAWKALFGGNLYWLRGGAARAATTFQPNLLYVHKWEHQPSIEELLCGPAPLVRMVHDH